MWFNLIDQIVVAVQVIDGFYGSGIQEGLKWAVLAWSLLCSSIRVVWELEHEGGKDWSTGGSAFLLPVVSRPPIFHLSEWVSVDFFQALRTAFVAIEGFRSDSFSSPSESGITFSDLALQVHSVASSHS